MENTPNSFQFKTINYNYKEYFPKKEKKATLHQDEYNTERLVELGIINEDETEIIDEEEREF